MRSGQCCKCTFHNEIIFITKLFFVSDVILFLWGLTVSRLLHYPQPAKYISGMAHLPVTTTKPDLRFTLTAQVFDPPGTKRVKVYWRAHRNVHTAHKKYWSDQTTLNMAHDVDSISYTTNKIPADEFSPMKIEAQEMTFHKTTEVLWLTCVTIKASPNRKHV